MTAHFPTLVVRDPAGSEREVEITQSPFTLGRQGDNDLVLLDHRISRRHARVIREEDGYVLEDAQSRHGTYVNGERVDRRLLKDGDRIGLGVMSAYLLTFRFEAPDIASILDEIEKTPESPAPRLQHFNLLLQLAQMLHRAAALDEILAALVDSALKLFDADRGLLFLIGESGEPALRLARAKLEMPAEEANVALPLDVVRRVMETRREEVILENLADGRTAYETIAASAGQRAILALPLQKFPVGEAVRESLRHAAPQLLGVLYLETASRAAALTRLDRQTLDTLAVEGAMVIENAQLIRAAREQERSRHELTLAQTIQRSLLPRALPRGGHFRLHAVTTACCTVGGDYYDAFSLPGGRVGLTIADVSGKGLPAAMMAMTLQGAFSALAAADLPLAELFRRTNRFLCDRTPPEMYATLFYGVLDPDGGFEYVNAGHAPPMVARNGGTVEVLNTPSFPVGMFEPAAFDVCHTSLRPGERVLVFSDGLPDAHNEAFEMLGEARVQQALASCAEQNTSPEDLCLTLTRAAENFAGSTPQADDVTVALLQFAPQADNA